MFALGAASCEGERPPPSDAGSVRLAAAWDESGRPLAAIGVCEREGPCADLAVGHSLGAGLVSTDVGQSARVELGDQAIVLGPESVLAVAPDGFSLERGSARLSRGLGPDELVVRAGESTVRLPKGRWAEVILERRGESSALQVRRGRALVEAAGEQRELGKGQSLELDASRPPTPGYASLFRAPPEAAPVAAAAPPPSPPTEAAPEIAAPRGLGRMTARRPGQQATIAGVTLASHQVHVEIEGGVARTTVEEVFENETDEVLEGRFTFPVPPEAAVSDLKLWVGDKLVPAEMVERKRAAGIFKGIVDDTVRPRDPALLEWKQGQELSLSIFPLPARGTRRVQFSFEQPVSDLGGRGVFVYPLSHDAARATPVKLFAFGVRIDGRDVSDVALSAPDATLANTDGGAAVSFEQRDFRPTSDLVLSYRRAPTSGAELSIDPLAVGASRLPGAATLRVRALPDPEDALAAAAAGDRVFVLDKSASQTRESLAAQIDLLARALDDAGEADEIAVLACDSRCVAYPETGRTAASADAKRATIDWARALSPAGASDLAGALVAANDRVVGARAPQVVVLGDGVPTAGELRPASLAARARGLFSGADLRFVGVGRTVDGGRLAALADELGAGWEPLASNDEEAREAVALALAQPLLRDLEVALPEGLTLAAPAPRVVRLGQELRLSLEAAPDADLRAAEIVMHGSIGDDAVELRRSVRAHTGAPGAASRAVARERIAALGGLSGRYDDEIVALSRDFFVMSPLTSLLVLENDAMFRSFGIERTRREEDGASEWPFLEAPRTKRPEVANKGGWGEGIGAGASDTAPRAVEAARSAAERAERGPIGLGDIGTIGHGAGIGDAFGAGGLGLSGIGEGGGGRGGIGTGTGQGIGSGAGRLGGDHKSSAPRVRMGATSVSGRLPPEVIQRIVRQNFGRFRLCYENELRANPSAQGRVTTKFVIGRDGAVASVASAGEGFSAGMTNCIRRAFTGLSFPQPEGGVVSVTYPVLFSPDGDARSTGWGRRSFAPAPAELLAGTDKWFGADAQAVKDLEGALAAHAERRSAHASLIRRLMKSGRFEDAETRARAYVAIDPDRAEPHELLAQALLAQGRPSEAVTALETLVELDAESVTAHKRLAMAFEANGDEPRACAHWRSAHDLAPADASYKLEALRCRARVLGEKAEVGRELAALLAGDRRDGAGDTALRALAGALSAGVTPAWEAPKTSGLIEVRAACDKSVERADCPYAISIDPVGNVVSERLPSAAARPFADGWTPGQVRALVVGGKDDVQVAVQVNAFGQSQRTTLRRKDRRTAFTAVVPQPMMGFGSGW